jgi:hypothetical protein
MKLNRSNETKTIKKTINKKSQNINNRINKQNTLLIQAKTQKQSLSKQQHSCSLYNNRIITKNTACPEANSSSS